MASAGSTPKPRRAKGEGSLFRHRTATTKHLPEEALPWCAQVSMVGPDGARRYVRGYGPSKAAALANRSKNLAALAKGAGRKPSKKTLKDATKSWADAQPKQTEYVLRSVRTISIHFPTMEKLSLGEITKTKLETALAKAEKSGPAAGRNAYRAIRGVLNFAVKQGWLGKSPLGAIQEPNYRPAVKQKDDLLIDDRMSTFYALNLWALEKSHPMRTILLFMGLGLRPGELLGIEWTSFTRAKATTTLTVDRRVMISPARIEKGSKNGEIRTIPLPPHVVNELAEFQRAWKPAQEAWAENQVFNFRRQDGTFHGSSQMKV